MIPLTAERVVAMTGSAAPAMLSTPRDLSACSLDVHLTRTACEAAGATWTVGVQLGPWAVEDLVVLGASLIASVAIVWSGWRVVRRFVLSVGAGR